VLSVGPSLNVLVCVLGHDFAHLPLDLGKIGDIAIVHNCVNTECERMAVRWRYCRSCCSPNVCENHLSCSVAAD
jgi:hypothetical protein